jgi:site-specific DNA recombinase
VCVPGPDGRRSHVAREIEPTEAQVIRQIFHMSAAGHGFKAIAIALNTEGAPSPRAQQSRSRSWAPSSVREALFRPLYRGEIVWNRTKKRDRWGQVRQTAQPESAWVRLPVPELRIVTDEEWTAAHARLSAARSIYLAGTGGRAFGRPALHTPSKYLLTNLASCAKCGGPMKVR